MFSSVPTPISMPTTLRLLPALVVLALTVGQSQAAPMFFFDAATPYLSDADIPTGLYAGGSPSFLEDFEDNNLDASISVNVGSVVGPEFSSNIDSVDADDGTIDGFGNSGRTIFNSSGPQGITFTFPAGTTAAGLVWTDGTGTVTFEAFGPSGSLGTISDGSFVDGNTGGTTGEDRFFGASDLEGITALRISNSSGGIEVDHVQYGDAIPEPSTIMLAIIGLSLLCKTRR